MEEKNTNPIEFMKSFTNVAVATSLFCSTLFIGDEFSMSSSSTISLRPPEVSAAVAPLADVGLREFLVKDGKEFLRLSLPTSLPTSEDPTKLGDTGRIVQESIELVRLRLEQVGFSGKPAVWSAALKEVNTAKSLIDTPDMIKGINGKDKKKDAMELVEEAKGKMEELIVAVRKQDITSTLKLQEETGALIGQIRELSLTPGTLPYKIPSEYDKLPRLRGRATVECKIVRANNPKPFVLADGTKTNEMELTMIVDGYHTPLTSGNFVDLVQRKFYDNMPIQSVGDLVVQTGKPPGSSVNGFVDPSTKTKRTIPLELFYKKDSMPTYGYTSDDDLRATEGFVTPFQAYGALGMEYSIEDEEGVNSGSTEFWFLKWDQNLLAPGRNTLDGSHACFGYIVDGSDLIGQLKEGDKIEYMKVVQGSENFSKSA